MSGRPRLVVGRRPLADVVGWARAALAEGGPVDLVVADPDDGDGLWPGQPRPDGVPHRSWRAWHDLAAELRCSLATPEPLGDGHVRCTLRPLGPEAPWHGAAAPSAGPSVPREDAAAPSADASVSPAGAMAPRLDGPASDARRRYAAAEGFGSVDKLEDPGFLLPLLEALERVRPPDGGRVLVLGCHRGDEVAALSLLAPAPRDLDVVGVDHAPEPLALARSRFPGARFVEADVGRLPGDLGRFDLIVAVAVFQSRGVDDRALLRRLVQDHATPTGGLLVGVPACRFRGHDVVWGPRTRNFREVDLSLVVQDLATYRRYLHQHRYRTHVGGRYDLLLSAWRTVDGAGARGTRGARATMTP